VESFSCKARANFKEQLFPLFSAHLTGCAWKTPKSVPVFCAGRAKAASWKESPAVALKGSDRTLPSTQMSNGEARIRNMNAKA
jgi:hypothetical protein